MTAGGLQISSYVCVMCYVGDLYVLLVLSVHFVPIIFAFQSKTNAAADDDDELDETAQMYYFEMFFFSQAYETVVMGTCSLNFGGAGVIRLMFYRNVENTN